MTAVLVQRVQDAPNPPLLADRRLDLGPGHANPQRRTLDVGVL